MTVTAEPRAVDTSTRQRVRGLLDELDDVRQDKTMAARFNTLTTRSWLAELACEEHDCWCHLAEALAPHQSDAEVPR